MSKTFEFYFDIVSPYSYLAATQIAGLEKRTGAACNWKPFFLGGVMQATGNKPPLMNNVPPKVQWLMRDVQDWADYYGVKLGFPSGQFPFNSLKYERVLTAAAKEKPEAVPKLALELYERLWGRSGKPEDPAVITGACEAAGLDAAKLLAAAETPEIKDRLKAVTDEAIKAGAFGAPTFIYNGRLFWGNDRMCILEKALLK